MEIFETFDPHPLAWSSFIFLLNGQNCRIIATFELSHGKMRFLGGSMRRCQRFELKKRPFLSSSGARLRSARLARSSDVQEGRSKGIGPSIS